MPWLMSLPGRLGGPFGWAEYVLYDVRHGSVPLKTPVGETVERYLALAGEGSVAMRLVGRADVGVETVVVGDVAGGVGGVVAQLLKKKGVKVVGLSSRRRALAAATDGGGCSSHIDTGAEG